MKLFTCLFVLLSLIAGGIALPAAATAAEKRVIIGFRQAPGSAEAAAVTTRKGKIGRKFKHLRAMTATLSEAEITKLKNDPLVAYVQEDTLIQAIDPLAAEYQQSWGVSRIGGAVAHCAGHLGTGAKVAIIDTGIDFNHPELIHTFGAGTSFVQDLNGGIINPNGEDDNGHGTHVAGIVAAVSNQTGAVGVAPQARLYAAKVLDGAGRGLDSWILAGIDWAIGQDVDIINLSLSLDTDSPALADAMQRAWDAGILLVASAGNAGGAVAFPAAYDTVIAVGATDLSDLKSSFSNFGLEIELAAPGTAIVSTYKDGGYSSISGTSQAAPHVAGVAALLISTQTITDQNNSGGINDEIRQRLTETAEDLGAAGRDASFGYGLVDAATALGLDRTQLCGSPTDPPVVDPPAGPLPVADMLLERQSRHAEDDAQQAILSGGRYTITVRNNQLKSLQINVLKNGLQVDELSGTLTFNRKNARGVTISFDASAGPYQVVFIPKGKFGSSATLSFGTAESQALGEAPATRKQRRLAGTGETSSLQGGSIRKAATVSTTTQSASLSPAASSAVAQGNNRKYRRLP